MQSTGVTVIRCTKYRRKRTFGFRKTRGIYLLAEKRFASQEEVCSLEFLRRKEKQKYRERNGWWKRSSDLPRRLTWTPQSAITPAGENTWQAGVFNDVTPQQVGAIFGSRVTQPDLAWPRVVLVSVGAIQVTSGERGGLQTQQGANFIHAAESLASYSQGQALRLATQYRHKIACDVG